MIIIYNYIGDYLLNVMHFNTNGMSSSQASNIHEFILLFLKILIKLSIYV